MALKEECSALSLHIFVQKNIIVTFDKINCSGDTVDVLAAEHSSVENAQARLLNRSSGLYSSIWIYLPLERLLQNGAGPRWGGVRIPGMAPKLKRARSRMKAIQMGSELAERTAVWDTRASFRVF